MLHSPLILAVDTADLEIAKELVSKTSPYIGVFKLGLEFYLKFGAPGVESIKSETNSGIFLDLKLHDIPNTVGAAALQVSHLNPEFLTVHASGGGAMVRAATLAAPECKITAVTLLTSLDTNDLLQIGFVDAASKRAAKLAEMAANAGARAIVCSPLEIEEVKSTVGEKIEIITPGIRPKRQISQISQIQGGQDDQKRVLDPKSAIALGANFLVVGRPITEANDVALAAKELLLEAQS